MPLNSPRLWHGPTNKHQQLSKSLFPQANGVYVGMLIHRDAVGPPGLLSGGTISSDMDITQLEGATNGINKNQCLLSYTSSIGTAQATWSTFINQITGHHAAVPVLSVSRGSYTFAQIAAGTADTDINKLVNACLAAAPNPILIRFAWEFNGQFQINYPVYTSAGLQDFANSHIKIKTLLHNAGATNTYLLFTPNQFYDGTVADGNGNIDGNYDISTGYNSTGHGYSWNPFYSAGGAINHLSFPDDPFYSPPAWGGKWIDAFGYDSYNQAGNYWLTFYQATRNGYSWFNAVNPNLPIFVTETGCGDPTTGKDGHAGGAGYDTSKGHGLIKPGVSSTAETKTQWIVDTFGTTLPYFSQIAGWMWFNLSHPNAGGYYKVEEFQATGTGENVLATYATQIANSYYLSAIQ